MAETNGIVKERNIAEIISKLGPVPPVTLPKQPITFFIL